MQLTESSQGTAPFHVHNAGKACFTWYKIIGTLQPSSTSITTPLICLHGGPGAGHEYLLSLADLWTQHQIPVILYDQLGCGQSTALPEKSGDESFWTEDLFQRELENLLKHLGIRTYDILGHSWGGMLAASYATRQPPGLQKLILVGTPASVELVLKGSAELRRQLSQDVQDICERYEREGGFDAPEYRQACLEFYKRFLCRLEPWPEELARSMRLLEEDPTVYRTMFGPSELICTGNLKGWTVIPNAHKIRQNTLLINGAYDETVEYATAPFFARIPKVKWVILPNSSHMGMWEERERFMGVVSDFLGSGDQDTGSDLA